MGEYLALFHVGMVPGGLEFRGQTNDYVVPMFDTKDGRLFRLCNV